MSILLCHRCYCWVEPQDGFCPDCSAAVDINEADPPLSQLREILGAVTQPLGEVTVRRRRPPRPGVLYATTNGLYFLPHLVVDRPATGFVMPAEHVFMSSMAAALRAPLSLCTVFSERNVGESHAAGAYRPQRLALEQQDAVPRSLMNDPGAFFVPSTMIQNISRRFGAWIIHRSHSTKLKFLPTSPREAFDDNMANLTATPPWKRVVT